MSAAVGAGVGKGVGSGKGRMEKERGTSICGGPTVCPELNQVLDLLQLSRQHREADVSSNYR